MKLVLASGSPRRRELLCAAGITDFEVFPAKGEEKADPALPPKELVISLARAKASEVFALKRDALVIAADTVVWAQGRVFGKPKDEAEARIMLKALSGTEHKVYTGLCIMKEGETLCDSVCTRVFFRELCDAEIDGYIGSGEPMDKAGAYGIQGIASLFVEKIEGEYSNVVGLPLCRLGQMLKSIGVQLL